MGNKRKASVLDEPVYLAQLREYAQHSPPSHQDHPFYTSPSTASTPGNGNGPPSLTSSPFSSKTTSSIPTPPTTRNLHQHQMWNVPAIPYLNSRTRKRHRDDRPDETQIHDLTMKKLYDAQRLHLDEAMSISEVLPNQDDDGDEDMDFDYGTVRDELRMDMDSNAPTTGQMKQKTLDCFFGRKQEPRPAATSVPDHSALPAAPRPVAFNPWSTDIGRSIPAQPFPALSFAV